MTNSHPVFIIARHADAGRKRTWTGPDRGRPLSRLGHEQALGLASQLDWLRGPHLVSSPYARCLQTLQPIAQRDHRTIDIDRRLTPHASTRRLTPADDLFDNAVVCTHGETIGALLREWVHADLVRLSPPPRSKITKNSTAKGGAWLFSRTADTLVGQYLPPLLLGPLPDLKA